MSSETTPLLPATIINAKDDFPPILSAAQRLPPNPNLFDFENLYPRPLGHAQPLRAVAFHLLLVLHLLSDSNKYFSSRRWNTIQSFQVSHDQDSRRENLRGIALAILSHVPGAIAEAGLPGATEGVPEDMSVEHILLAPFPRDTLSPQMLRVIDRLAHPAVPTEVLTDPIISLSLIRLWMYGETSLVPLPSESIFHRILRIYDAGSTPRAVHAVHIMAHLVYLVLLSHLILYPSPRPLLVETPGGPVGFREPIVAIYSISNVCFSPLSPSSFPHVSVLSSLLISLPTSPSPDAISYSLLVLALCLHILFLQFPTYPTLPLLLEPTRWLPLSSLYVACVVRYLLPALVFLLPVLLASIVLLSLSLSGPSVIGQAIVPAPSAPPSAFLALFCIGCFLFLYLSVSTLLLSPSPRGNDIRCDWEKYGVGVGIAGRRSLIRAILAYSPSCHPFNSAYPPPLNILSVPLAILPVLPHQVYKLFERLIIGPFAFVAAGLWGWGLL